MARSDQPAPSKARSRRYGVLEVLRVSFKLGLTSFGGPAAHLGYFYEEYVRKRKWIDDRSYADLVALCQFLPGPASSQAGIGIGVIRAGVLGGIAAWLGFTLPSLIALTLFALLINGFDISSAGWIHGLKLVAVAIVAQAVWGMGQKLAADRTRASIAVVTAAITLIWQSVVSQVLLIAAAGVLGFWLYRSAADEHAPSLHVAVSRKTAAGCLALFFALLIGLPLLRQVTQLEWVAVLDSFYRAGSLVFGGGHVVLPLLEREVVPAGWVDKQDFLAGYGAAQAVPGPLFTFAGYVGAVWGGVFGAALATAAIFLPAFLLVLGALPFWNTLRSSPKAQGAMTGINAAVVGILLAALYQPLWTTSILAPSDFAFSSVLFVLLVFWKTPPWVVVAAGALGGGLLW
ncbi:chromate transporter [Brevibacillus sp. B_LB10_24]|uniref:chromate transporter n=1 Tax=Brevibacillus sp. B_LB10_24 TaxID=3380645 RepID=UPI0038BE0C8F